MYSSTTSSCVFTSSASSFSRARSCSDGPLHKYKSKRAKRCATLHDDNHTKSSSVMNTSWKAPSPKISSSSLCSSGRRWPMVDPNAAPTLSLSWSPRRRNSGRATETFAPPLCVNGRGLRSETGVSVSCNERCLLLCVDNIGPWLWRLRVADAMPVDDCRDGVSCCRQPSSVATTSKLSVFSSILHGCTCTGTPCNC